jgi:hypothetical protein
MIERLGIAYEITSPTMIIRVWSFRRKRENIVSWSRKETALGSRARIFSAENTGEMQAPDSYRAG